MLVFVFDMVLFGGMGDFVCCKLILVLFDVYQGGELYLCGWIFVIGMQLLEIVGYFVLLECEMCLIMCLYFGVFVLDDVWVLFVECIVYQQVDVCKFEQFDGLVVVLGEDCVLVIVCYLVMVLGFFIDICKQFVCVGLNMLNVWLVLEKFLGIDFVLNEWINFVVV